MYSVILVHKELSCTFFSISDVLFFGEYKSHFDCWTQCYDVIHYFCVLESKKPVDELKSYGRLGPETVMFNYSGCAGIIIVEADRLGVGSIHLW